MWGRGRDWVVDYAVTVAGMALLQVLKKVFGQVWAIQSCSIYQIYQMTYDIVLTTIW